MMKKINYNYLPQEFADVEDIITDWRALIKTCDFTLGHAVAKFEEEFAQFVGAKHCISTNNGTDALILSLKAFGIGRGDEVITVANTFYATAGAIAAVGATPVLVDCNDRMQICYASTMNAMTTKTSAIIAVHWGGGSPLITDFRQVCDECDIPLIEDACMGIGTTIGGKAAGTFGNVGAFSMHPMKSLNVMGDGGMIVTDDDHIAEWARKYRNHGMTDRDHIEFWGVNMRLQPLQAIVAMHGLRKLPKTLEIRRRNAAILDKGLEGIAEVNIPARLWKMEESFCLYLGLFESRNLLQKHLSNKGIETKIHYPVPLHHQEAVDNFMGDNCKNATYQADHVLSLPVHQFLTESDMHYIVESVAEFYAR